MKRKKELSDPKLYINRELSLLQFNYRVLEQAKDPSVPLLERLKYLLICSANLDEFFEVRVAGLKEKQILGSLKTGPDGMAPTEILKEISTLTHTLVEAQYQTFNETLLPELEKEKIRIVPQKKWKPALKTWVRTYFRNEILPLLSPVGLDMSHPFPRLVNKSLNFLVSLDGKDAFGRDSGLAIIHAPSSLPRIIKIPDGLHYKGDNFIFLASIISAHAENLFTGMTVTGCYQFRLTRNSDLLVDEDDTEDLVRALQDELHSRRFRNAVRLEIAHDCPEAITNFLLQKHQLTTDDLYHCQGPVNLSRYVAMLEMLGHKELRFPELLPVLPEQLEKNRDIFKMIRENDILLHHPYQSFIPVIRFLHQATIDPCVLDIKQTLYRTSVESSVVQALIDAARAGKQVTAVIELRARFEEASNIELANRLQEAGALVVYGVVGFKTHAKLTLIVRREDNKLKRYAHLGTGNYRETTATQYTDLGLLTYDDDITGDVQKVFQQLTGMGKTIKMKKLFHAPFTLSKSVIDLIENEIKFAKQGKPAQIIAKINGLTDVKIIQSLYKASKAGVKIDLIVRGICSLRPGMPRVSENIRVHSIVDRFLEHSRIYYFNNNGEEKIYCSSADWMQRNLYYRIEVCFPIEDKKLLQRVKKEGLLNYINDNSQSWLLDETGLYTRKQPGGSESRAAQWELMKKFNS